jgi:DNA-binding MarR family transcriptional regulator
MEQISPHVALLINLAKAQTVLASKFTNGCLGSLSFNEFLVLHHVSQSGVDGIQRIALAKKVGLSASGVTRLLAPMEKIHLITNDEVERDARIRLVQITDAGKERFADALDRLDLLSESIIPSASKKNIQYVSDFLLSVAVQAQIA